MPIRKRGLLNLGSSGAGLASLAGAGGDGFRKAGDYMIAFDRNLEKDKLVKVQQDQQTSIEDNARWVKGQAAKKEAQASAEYAAKLNAMGAKNRALNPAASNAIIKSFGLEADSPLAQPGAPSNANSALGLIDLGAPKSSKVKSKFVSEDGFMHLILDDNSTKNTGIKAKDYWESKSGKGGAADAPDGYIRSSDIPEMNMNGGALRNLLGAANGFTEKGGVQYVNLETLNLARDRLGRNRVDDVNIK